MSERPILVVSDLHLGPVAPPQVEADLIRLLDEHPGAELIMAGDVLDLSMARASEPAESAMAGLLARYSTLVTRWRRHVLRGGLLTFIPGNHDASMGVSAVRNVLLERLELTGEAPVRVASWFVRRGGTHVEHGHVYDPDNAPAHPLALWSPVTEPLGITLTRRFLVPSDALEFAHAHETTPLAGLARVFRLFGARAPWVVYQYFAAAIGACIGAGRGVAAEVSAEIDEGGRRMRDFAASVGLSEAELKYLVMGREDPTHLSRKETFMRLYFDRVLATLFAAGASVGAAAGSRAAAGLASASAAYLLFSLAKGANRYSSKPKEYLRQAAANVRRATGADLVIFGHTHQEDDSPGYLNSGSFAFASDAGRPYVVVPTGGVAERRRFRQT